MDYQNNAQQQSCSKTDKTNKNINTDEILEERNASKIFRGFGVQKHKSLI